MYGIEILTNINHANSLDRENNNTLWRDAVAKEMTKIGIDFDLLAERYPELPVWSKVTGNLVWDLKMDFTRKARWVLDRHKTINPIGYTYASLVSRYSTRIAFTYAVLNRLNVCAAGIKNAYLQYPSHQNNYIICGPEFGIENVGKVDLIHRAVYGGKSAGRDLRNHLRSCMRDK